MSRSNTFDLVGLVGRYRDVGAPCIYPDLMMKLAPKSDVSSAFLEVVLRSTQMRSKIKAIAQGTSGSMVKVSAATISNLRIRIPSLAEQQGIMEILNAIDAGIDGERQLVAKRQAVFSALAESLLVESLAYPLVALGSIVDSAVDGPFGSNLKSEHYVDGPGVRVVRLQNIGIGKFLDGDRAYIGHRHAASLGRHDVRGGDLLVASLGDERHPMARACLYPEYPEAGIVKADCFRIRANPGLALNSFIMRVLNSQIVKKVVAGAAQGVTRDRVNLSSLLSIKIPLPPINFQCRLIQVLDAQGETIRSTEGELAKLQTLKVGMIDELLTGRVRVTSVS
jgi:type I restriction enzyme S subunit